MGPTSAFSGAEVCVGFVISVVLFILSVGLARGPGSIKNPRPFPAVGFCRNRYYARQVPTASSPTTTITPVRTCRTIFINGAKIASNHRKGQARIRGLLGKGVWPSLRWPSEGKIVEELVHFWRSRAIVGISSLRFWVLTRRFAPLIFTYGFTVSSCIKWLVKLFGLV